MDHPLSTFCDEELQQYTEQLAACPWASGIYEVRTSFHVVVVELVPTQSPTILAAYSFPNGTIQDGEVVSCNQ